MTRIVFCALLILLLAVTGFAVNRIAFDALMSRGEFCHATTGATPADSGEQLFTTNSLCWASGIRLEKGKRYCITLTIVDDWLDRSEHADAGGFRTDTLVHFNAALLRRRWGENWFAPIAKIGNTGGDEYVLTSTSPLPPVRYEAPGDVPGSRFEQIPAAAAAAIIDRDPTPPWRKRLTAEITARSSGELFLFVNDAVLGLPRYAGLFYQNNRGSAKVNVTVLPGQHTCS